MVLGARASHVSVDDFSMRFMLWPVIAAISELVQPHSASGVIAVLRRTQPRHDDRMPAAERRRRLDRRYRLPRRRLATGDEASPGSVLENGGFAADRLGLTLGIAPAQFREPHQIGVADIIRAAALPAPR